MMVEVRNAVVIALVEEVVRSRSAGYWSEEVRSVVALGDSQRMSLPSICVLTLITSAWGWCFTCLLALRLSDWQEVLTRKILALL